MVETIGVCELRDRKDLAGYIYYSESSNSNIFRVP